MMKTLPRRGRDNFPRRGNLLNPVGQLNPARSEEISQARGIIFWV